MPLELAPCLACDAEVPVEATLCSECGYDVTEHDRSRLVLGGLGMALSLTGVLAVVGVPLLVRAHLHGVAARGSITRREAADLPGHLARVLRRQLEFDPAFMERSPDDTPP